MTAAGRGRVKPSWSWGPELLPEGGVRFRIWAPGCDSLKLRLGDDDRPMQRNAEGWFERVEPQAGAGSRYGFVLPDGMVIADPAARAQVGDVLGLSLVTDPDGYDWKAGDWTGRPWEEAVIYELHVGTFTPEGSFAAAAGKLRHLRDLGITAVEIMPVAQFAGDRGWGYDGVLLYAPHRAYGGPEGMKAFIDAAHGHGISVLLDVVYNHFGPEGNFLPKLAPQFFHPEHQTPWGGAIAYEKPPVRQFFTENALYWLHEFRLDGLRFDAIDHVRDPDSPTEILVEIAERIRAEFPDRPIHLTTEDNRNITRLHERGEDGRVLRFTGEWNDDFHNAAHVVATGETDGYYEDFAEQPIGKLARALAEGFVYQGEPAPHHGGEARGEPSAHLPPTAFVDFLQNHDQVGNRALGERLTVLCDEPVRRVLSAMLLLSPHIPLIFMGEEWAEERPFFFFTDFHGELAEAVRKGRRREFAKFAAFESPERQKLIPDPNALETFERSKLDWSRSGGPWLGYVGELLDLRRRHVVPLLAGAGGHSGRKLPSEEGVVAVEWALSGGRLAMRANLSGEERQAPAQPGAVIFSFPPGAAGSLGQGRLPPWSIAVSVDQGGGA